MSQHNFFRSIINGLLPPGPKWAPEEEKDFDKFLDGIAKSFPGVKTFIDSLASLRDPKKTEFLDDLEREYGIITKNNLTESVRRDQLAVKAYEKGGTGSTDNIQEALNQAGFDVLVHSNSPAVDPAIFLTENFQITVGDTLNGFVGDPEAYLGLIGGKLLVNGPIFSQYPLYLFELGGPNSFVGDPEAVLGRFDELSKTVQEYPIPTDPESWPFVFFVGGEAIRDGSGALIDIEQAEIEQSRLEEFENIILAYKPIHSWAGLIITIV